MAENSAPADLLLPCPFCGGAAEYIDTDWAHHIHCTNDACMAFIGISGRTKEQLFAAWNRRPAQPEGDTNYAGLVRAMRLCDPSFRQHGAREYLVQGAAAIEALVDDRDGYERIFELQRKRERPWIERWRAAVGKPNTIPDYGKFLEYLLDELERLQAIVNNPQTVNFLDAVKAEAAHQVERWGTAHDRSKSAENWYWLVGYLSGKALRAAITGDREKALHHTISSGAALAHWHAAIAGDQSGCGRGADADLAKIESAAQ